MEPTYRGLPLSAWVKVGTVSVLMAAMFRFNLARLWNKTNPFYGQPNWGHAVIVPIVGLYYLYVNRRDLLSALSGQPGRWSLPRSILVLWACTIGLLWATCAFIWVLFPTVGLLALLPPILATVLPIVAYVSAAAYSYSRPKTVTFSLRLNDALTRPLLGSFERRLTSSDPAATPQSVLRVAPASGVATLPLDYSKAQTRLERLATRLPSLAWRTSDWFGGFVMLWGILFSVYGIWPGQNDFFKDVGMVITLFGVVLMMGGWRVMRVAWFPILFLFCALPWPDLIYSRMAMPLQLLAAKVAVHLLNPLGVESMQFGTKISMRGSGGALRILNVAEACAGLRSLMTFVALGGAWAFLSSRPLWQKFLITASAVPIAVFCNTMRVTGQGLLDHYWSQQWSESFAHQFVGLVMMIPAFLLILLVCSFLDNLFVDVDEATEPKRPDKIVRGGQAKPAAVGTAVADSALTVMASPARLVAQGASSRSVAAAQVPTAGAVAPAAATGEKRAPKSAATARAASTSTLAAPSAAPTTRAAASRPAGAPTPTSEPRASGAGARLRRAGAAS